MLVFTLPDGEEYRLLHLCLDLNGTLALDGVLRDGVAEQVVRLAQKLTVHLLTAGTHGGVAAVESAIKVRAVPIARGAEKALYVERLGGAQVVAIGNGRNDAEMLRAARLGIAVLGPEGLALAALRAADIVAPDPLSALSLLEHPKRLVATLRA